LLFQLSDLGGDHFLFEIPKRLHPLMGGFDVTFAFDARQRDLLRGQALGLSHVALLRLIDYDSLKLFFLIEKV
jgi:hypothetical protein